MVDFFQFHQFIHVLLERIATTTAFRERFSDIKKPYAFIVRMLSCSNVIRYTRIQFGKVFWRTVLVFVCYIRNMASGLRRLRNSIQHLCTPYGAELSQVTLEFFCKNIDPLIKKHFNLNAIEFHEDPSIGYEFFVSSLIRLELLFSVPDNFKVTEIDLQAELSQTFDS